MQLLLSPLATAISASKSFGFVLFKSISREFEKLQLSKSPRLTPKHERPNLLVPLRPARRWRAAQAMQSPIANQNRRIIFQISSFRAARLTAVDSTAWANSDDARQVGQTLSAARGAGGRGNAGARVEHGRRLQRYVR